MSEREGTIWCPRCRTLYGELYREPINETVWTHVTVPAVMPTYCSLCECPTERRV